MDTSNHFNLASLFAQLGLPSQQTEINQFIEQHSIASEQRIDQGEFWNLAQADFLRECIEQDSDWAELVDHLDAMLRG